MKLMTKELEKKLEKYPLGSQENKKLGEHKVLAKYFGGSGCTWLVCEAKKLTNKDYYFFGCVSLDGGKSTEYGYFLLSELKSLKFKPFGLGVERALYGEPNIVADEFENYRGCQSEEG